MIRTGAQYRDSLRDGRQVFVDFDWDGPLDVVQKAAGLSDRARGWRRL